MAFARLGLTSFGGPVAHIGYFHREFVLRRGWVEDAQFAQLLALCQFLPGPTSSQLGFALGLLRAGWRGALAAFVAFTLPSAVLLFCFAMISGQLGGAWGGALLHGFKLVAVAVVAHAVVTMARALTPDVPRALLAISGAAVALSWSSAWMQLSLIAAGALLGVWLCRHVKPRGGEPLALPFGRRSGSVLLGTFAVLLLLAVIAAPHVPAAAFYRAGASVFGGGHVVLPLLEQSVVAPGWVDRETFLAGYGAAQAVPGPMFSFAAFLGECLPGPYGGVVGAVVCLLAIFLPGLLLVASALPFWSRLSKHQRAAGMMAGVNAVVVGLLAAALAHPVATSAIRDATDFTIAGVAFVLLLRARWPVLAVIASCVTATLLARALHGA